MNGTPLSTLQFRPPVDGLSKYIEHPAKELFADANPHRLTGVDKKRTLSQALCGRQRDSTHHFRIKVGLYLNGCLAIITCPEEAMNKGEFLGKTGVNHASAD